MTDSTETVCFLMVSGFALMSYASALEPLRAANQRAGRTLYRWRHATPDGKPAHSSSGLAIAPDVAVGETGGIDRLAVVAAAEGAAMEDAATLAWLRRLAQRGVRLGGVSGGPFVQDACRTQVQFCAGHPQRVGVLEEFEGTFKAGQRGRITDVHADTGRSSDKHTGQHAGQRCRRVDGHVEELQCTRGIVTGDGRRRCHREHRGR